jgi:hypothetical protein
MPFTTDEQILLSSVMPTDASHTRLAALAPAVTDWAALVQRAETLSLAPLLRFHLAQLRLLDTLPATARTRLDKGHHVWAARHLAYVNETERLLKAFANAGIAALPLKGAALLLLKVYPPAGLRPALDLDLLIKPTRLTEAEGIAADCGYEIMPGRTQARPLQRLPNELNHAAPRRGPSGLILELHTRAFHFVQSNRDFGWAEMAERAAPQNGWLMPAAEDLALHLIHHTMADWQSTRAILRTLADLHFLFARESDARMRLRERAKTFGLQNAVSLAKAALALLAESSLAELQHALAQKTPVSLLLETALLSNAHDLAEAARLFEYLDFSRQPTERLRQLGALLFTNRAHLKQLYGEEARAKSYVRRPFDLLRKFPWASLRPETLWRVWRLRQIQNGERERPEHSL